MAGAGRFSSLILALSLLLTGNVRADAASYLTVGPSVPPERSRAWVTTLSAALDVALRPLTDTADPDAELAVSAQQLSVLEDVERALLEARELNARFREAAALGVLWRAEQALLEALTLPGVHAYLAEVYVQLGLCAAQLGELGLAETALRRAASLDGTRRIEAAEAPPAVLTLAREIARSHDAVADSELPVVLTPASATLWIDGVRRTGQSLRAQSGEHVLVVRAAGYAPYASVVQLSPGLRPALEVTLSPLPSQTARATLLTHHSDVASAREPARQLAEATGAPLFLLEPAAWQPQRVRVWRCLAQGCSPLLGIDEAGLVQRFANPHAAHAFLTARPAPTPAPHTPMWKRWPVWTAAAAVVVAGVTSALWVRAGRDPRRERVLEVTPDPLPP